MDSVRQSGSINNYFKGPSFCMLNEQIEQSKTKTPRNSQSLSGLFSCDGVMIRLSQTQSHTRSAHLERIVWILLIPILCNHTLQPWVCPNLSDVVWISMYIFAYPISLVVGQLHLKKGVQLSKATKDSSYLSHVKPSAIPCTTNSSALEIAQTYNHGKLTSRNPEMPH